MARTIGRRRLEELRALTRRCGSSMNWSGDVHKRAMEVTREVRPDWFEIWEGAHTEISNGILSAIVEQVHRGD